MTRKEENQKLLNEMVNLCEKEQQEDDFDYLTPQDFYVSMITYVLADISKSLAVIADSMSKKEGEE